MIAPQRVAVSELKSALYDVRGALVSVAVLSAVINVLTLSGSIYLMMVYDRVLPAQSVPTLLSLFLMVGVAYAFHGVFDVMRSQILGDVALELDRCMNARTQAIEFRLALERPDLTGKTSPLRDLDRIRGFIASGGVPALIDLPWIVFFVLILTLVHYWLGVVTVAGAIGLALLAYRAERIGRAHSAAATDALRQQQIISDRHWRHAELISVLGMHARAFTRWNRAHEEFLVLQSRISDATAALSGASKIFRIFLQSAVLTVGALLVIDGKATAGVIFASSLLLGRALAPVDQAIANWRNFVAAREAWGRLDLLFHRVSREEHPRTALPEPHNALSVERLVVAPPGSNQATVAEVSFSATAGKVVGIIGPSGSGKSSLVRGVVGAWKPLKGSVRLDHAAIDQWDREALGAHIGYLPQSVELFAGTVAENIARFEPDAPADKILAAARAAGVHEVIIQLPQGYETHIDDGGANISAGQKQRIALARALYGEPFLVVLDEPNSNLDGDGERALIDAIAELKKRGRVTLIVAHQGAVLTTADHLLLMRKGRLEAYGPKEAVLKKLRLNVARVEAAAASGLGRE